MKTTAKLMALTVTVAAILSAFCACTPGKKPNSETTKQGKDQSVSAFVPALDTTGEVTIDVASFFGNFEALDQVINHFNTFYPNVTVSYESYNNTNSDSFLKANPSIDIFMSSNANGYPTENCVDLLEAGVDVSAATETVIEGNKWKGTLYSLPMSLTLKGLVVNKTLLAEEGLEVPQTWPEFLAVLESLKQKGYTPIQGPDSAVSTLVYNMGMTMLNDDPELYKAVEAGDKTGAAALLNVFERLETLKSNGYFNTEVDAAYPEDNYDSAILRFLEGKVPFWVCDTEKVSGMKKRESKSETFTASPFEYEFMFAPLGENGAYAYIEPWYGFAVNKDSDVKDYAIEFLRFMAREEELNTLASVKGVPSIAKASADSRYTGLAATKTELALSSNGSVPTYYGTYLIQAAEELISGEQPDSEGALDYFLTKCLASSEENG